jgi:hypothetical protein
VQELIELRTQSRNLPRIFQFLAISEDATDHDDRITQAYLAALNKRSILEAEESGAMTVMPSRVECYVIAPLLPAHQSLCIQVGHVLKKLSRETLSGSRNAVFMIPQVTPESVQGPLSAARTIEAETKENLLFNRSFFIDQFDELGHALEQSDLIEMVARFISLALASELATAIRLTPPPYIGDGVQWMSYGSFGCCDITFDRGNFVELLSRHLLADIRQKLFEGSNRPLAANDALESAETWFAENLDKRTLVGPNNLDTSDLSLDEDFNACKRELDKIALEACRSFLPDVNAYSGFLDCLLKRAEIELEANAGRIRETRKQISELQIRILLGKQEEYAQQPQPESQFITVRRWPLIILFGALGLAGLIAVLILTNGQPQQQILLTFLAISSVGVALFFLWGHREREPDRSPQKPPPDPLEEQLRQKVETFRQQKKRENIHVALFTYLDLARANLEDLRTREIEPQATLERNVFDVDLSDEELIKEYYIEHYDTKDADLAAFTEDGKIEQIHEILFSNFGKKLFDHLRAHCKRRFERHDGYDEGKALRLQQSLGSRRHALDLASPLWHPLNTDGERTTLALTAAKGMRDLLNKTFGDKVQFFDTRDGSTTTVVQIAYGQELQSILVGSLEQTAAAGSSG